MRNASDITNAVKALDQLYHLSHDEDCALMAEGVMRPDTVCDCCLQYALAEVRMGLIAATKLDGLAAPRATPDLALVSKDEMSLWLHGFQFTTASPETFNGTVHRMAKEIARLLGMAPRARDWRESESAPKTGEHILVSNVGGGHFGHCGGKRQDWCGVVHYWDVPGEEGFYLSSGYPHEEGVETPIRFTHWMPLDALCDAVARHAEDGEDSRDARRYRYIREAQTEGAKFNGVSLGITPEQYDGMVDRAIEMRGPVSPTEEPTNG